MSSENSGNGRPDPVFPPVGMKEVRLDAKGLVKNPGGLYMSVIETLV